MQEKHQAHPGFARTVLPWVLAAGALLIYLITINHWVTLNSLAFTAKVTGWDWTLPLQAPLFYILTYPIRWLPAGVQPIALNIFAAVCSALTLALLARSVALLPHDRTHAQRQRERSENSLLTIPLAWIPPLFAAAILAFQMTFWEHATAATNEALDLLLFAYLIRCLLEFRIDQKESWLTRFALIYGLGATNNWALIGFFPLFLVALIWILGLRFFRPGFLLRMTAWGLLGLSLYFLLPIFWALSDQPNVGFWEALKAELANQKSFLFDTPSLRNRAFVLSLTSLLPLLILGIRWPSSFGDTSAAGAALTNLMFRVIHIVFLAACIWIFFDQRFSPRALGFGLPFLSFYYLSALAIGYLSGYILLVFGETKTKTWHRRSQGGVLLDYGLTGAVCLAAVAVPAALVYKNFNVIWSNNGPILKGFAEIAAKELPQAGAIILSDEPYSLLLLEAYLSREGTAHRNLLVHSGSLSVPDYHRALQTRYGTRWPDITQGVPKGEVIEDVTLLQLITSLGQSNRVFYLHPSFGFYFESFHQRPRGVVYELVRYQTNDLTQVPALQPADLDFNTQFWSNFNGSIQKVASLSRLDSRDSRELANHYSRALNYWGVELQKHQRNDQALALFRTALDLNSNNIPAAVNLEYNHTLRTGQARTNEIAKIIQDKLGQTTWDSVLVKNGPFDHPDFCMRFGNELARQNLFRQAAAQFARVQAHDPNHVEARLALADLLLKAGAADKALAHIETVRTLKTPLATLHSTQMELVRLEAAAHFAKSNYPSAERVLLEAERLYPDELGVLDGLVMLYGQTQQYTNALNAIDKILKVAPDNVQASINQATIHFNNQKYDQAVASLDRVLRRDSKNLQALLYKVFVYIESKNYKEAETEIERILNIDPENQQGLLYKAVVKIETKNYDAAIEPLDKLLDQNPPASMQVDGLRNRAIANLHRGKLGEAKADYERLQRLVPRYYVAYYGLGEIAYQQKQTADAIRYYDLYLRHSPTNYAAMQDERKVIEDRLRQLKNETR